MAVDKENLVESKFELDNNQFKQALREVMQEVKEAESATKKVNKSLADDGDKTAKKITGGFKGLLDSIMDLSFKAFIFTMIGKQIQGLITGMANLAKEADKFKISMIGLNSVAETFGQDGGTAQKMAKQLVEMSGGMLNLQQASQGMKALISSGFNLEEAFDVSKAMLDIGAFNNVVGDLGQAYTDATKGIKTGSVELTENIGLTQRFASIMKQAGVSIENGIDLTNNAAQRQAFYNSIMKQGAGFVGDLAKVQNEYTGRMAKTNMELKEFAVNFGKLLQPVLEEGASIVRYLAESFNSLFEKPKSEETILTELLLQIEQLKKVTKPTKEQQEELQATIQKVSLIAPSLITSYDNMGNAQLNYAEATKVLINMKRKELELTNEQLKATKKLKEQSLKDFDKIFPAERKWGVNMNTGNVLDYQIVDDIRTKLASDLKIAKELVTTEQMIAKLKSSGDISLAKMTGGSESLLKALEKELAEKNKRKAVYEKMKKETAEEIKLLGETIKGNEAVIALTPDAFLQAQLKLLEANKKKTDQKPDDNKPKYDAKEASQDFLQAQTLDYEKSLKELAVKRQEAKDQFDLDMIVQEENSAKKIFAEAQKIAEEIKKSESAKITDDIKFKFEKKKIEIEGEKDLNNSKIETMQENAQEILEEKEKEEKQIEKFNEEANNNIIKQQGELNEITLDAMREANKEQTELERMLAYEKLALKQEIANEEIRLNQEILNAKTSEEKEALQKTFDEKMNAFKLQAGQESEEKQKVISEAIKVEKEHAEAIKEVNDLLAKAREGEVLNWADSLEKIKGLTDQEKQNYEVSLVNAQDFAMKKQIINDMKLNIEETFRASTESIYAKIINGEKLSWSIMREMLKQNLRDRLLIDGQELAGTAIVETVKGIVASASGNHISATAHYHAAATAATGALALGAAASLIQVSPIEATKDDKKTSGTSGGGTDTNIKPPKEEEQKEIHIHNTSLRNIAIGLIPELESLAKDGYTKIVLEED